MFEYVCPRGAGYSLLCWVGFLCGLIGCGRGEYDKRMETKIQQLRTQAAAAPVEEPAPTTPAPAPDEESDEESADESGEEAAGEDSAADTRDDAASEDAADAEAADDSDESAGQ